jgi:hypothetical protein
MISSARCQPYSTTAVGAEDIDTGSEDHVADEARYGCMSRPWTPKPTEPVEVIYSSYRQADPPGTTEMEIFKRALI